MLNARNLQPPKRLFNAAPCPAFLFRTASRTACCLRRLFPLQVARFLSTCSFGTQGIQAIKNSGKPPGGRSPVSLTVLATAGRQPGSACGARQALALWQGASLASGRTHVQCALPPLPTEASYLTPPTSICLQHVDPSTRCAMRVSRPSCSPAGSTSSAGRSWPSGRWRQQPQSAGAARWAGQQEWALCRRE